MVKIITKKICNCLCACSFNIWQGTSHVINQQNPSHIKKTPSHMECENSVKNKIKRVGAGNDEKLTYILGLCKARW